MDTALEAAGLLVEQDTGEREMALIPIPGVTLDRIGPIPPSYDKDGAVIDAGDTRYHANLRVTVELTDAQVDALPTFDPAPTVPYRVFF